MTRQAIAAGRGARALARVVHAVPVRGGRRRPPTACARSRGRRACRSCSAAIRSSGGREQPPHPRQVLQLRVPRPGRRHDRRRLSEDAPGAVRRVRAAEAPAVLRGAARRSSVGLLGGRRRRCCCRSRAISISTAICYEIVYPDLVRQFVRGGSELLTTITNDAWFGPTSAPYQHFAQASMRAIENGRYLVRSANTGISGIVDPYGRVLEQSAVYQPAGRRRRGAVPERVDVLRAARRRLRVRVGRC